MRRLEAHPQCKGIVPVLVDILRRLSGNPRSLHLLVVAIERQFIRVQPNACPISKWPPLLRFCWDGGILGPRPDRLRPLSMRDIFCARDIEAMQPGLSRNVEVHLSKNRRFVSALCQLFGKRGLVIGKRRVEQRHSRRMWQLSGEQALPRGRADRRIAIVSRETRTLRRQPVQVRG